MAEKMVQKITLPYYGEVYVANEDEASLESMMQLQPALQKLYEYEQAELVPMAPARWRFDAYDGCWVCSNCGMSALNNFRGNSADSNYCPHCGAKMDGGNENG